MQISDYIGNLRLTEWNGGHSLLGTAVSNHRADEFSVFIVAHQPGSHEIRTFGATGCVWPVAEGTGLRKLGLATLDRIAGRVSCEEPRGQKEHHENEPVTRSGHSSPLWGSEATRT